MHILFTDESNLEPSREGRFFIYGGLLFPADHLKELHLRIEEIRREAGYRPMDLLKFGTNTRPTQVALEAATDAKRKVLKLCQRLDCRFIAYAILHDIARNQRREDIIQYACNTGFLVSAYPLLRTGSDCSGLGYIIKVTPDGEDPVIPNVFHLRSTGETWVATGGPELVTYRSQRDPNGTCTTVQAAQTTAYPASPVPEMTGAFTPPFRVVTRGDIPDIWDGVAP